MALDGTTLGFAIKTALIATGSVTPGPPLDAFAAAIATAVVEHIKNNALVTPTLLVAPPGGGPVTGTGTVT